MIYTHSKTNVVVILNQDDSLYFKDKTALFHNYATSRYIENDLVHHITYSEMQQLKLYWNLYLNDAPLDNEATIDKFIHLLGEFIKFGRNLSLEDLHRDSIFRIKAWANAREVKLGIENWMEPYD